MPGFLDKSAVSVEAEYTRYLDPDILGKIVLKNFAMNVLGIDERHIRIPISRQGDLGNYKDFCDAGIRVGSRTYSVETKCSRHNVAKKSRINAEPSPRWLFGDDADRTVPAASTTGRDSKRRARRPANVPGRRPGGARCDSGWKVAAPSPSGRLLPARVALPDRVTGGPGICRESHSL